MHSSAWELVARSQRPPPSHAARSHKGGREGRAGAPAVLGGAVLCQQPAEWVDPSKNLHTGVFRRCVRGMRIT